VQNRKVVLSVQAASKVYRMGEVDVPALREVSIDIYDGEFIIVVGPSGSGKTTLLNLIGGMDRPTSGTVRFLDQDLSKASDRQLTSYRRNQLTALENVQVAVEIVEEPMDPMEALRVVGLEDRADHFPSQLSGGEQQRVSVARALASNPRLLLCDEPTGAVDLENGKQILGLLAKVNRELRKTVVLITHNGAIADIGDRVALIRDGSIHSIKANEPPKPVEEIAW
jgi:putative ABC transport system ATP-binding protein